ncbi:MAG: glucose-6-phosphate isomerase [Candidatus Omnitrophica bacterium]|nr:glucose-6-phosphate isomerase [Candidatus Omnitrophota bacterium]
MEGTLKIDTRFLEGFVSQKDLGDISPLLNDAEKLLAGGKGPGSDFLGWMDLPERLSDREITGVENSAKRLSGQSDVIVVIGIGGSYLGAKAVTEMLLPDFKDKKIVFAGHQISGEYHRDLLDYLKDREVSVNVISKSGTTTEPAIAFRAIMDLMKKKYGENGIKDRIVCTTDRSKGALRSLASEKGFETFIVPDDVGGRFSVLTPVGLLPIACAGINIKDLVAGAREMRQLVSSGRVDGNLSAEYAAVRNILYRKGKKIEIMSNFDPKMHFVSEWWKQLYGESEGKNKKGIFPAACDFTTDLHSMGQWIQDGERDIFETFLIEEVEDKALAVPSDADDLDGLNYLAGKQFSFINKKAYLATAEAHFEGGVPNISILFPEKSAFFAGELIYFFEKAVALSAYALGSNPFDQPGVESYKKKMFKLLGKGLS